MPGVSRRGLAQRSKGLLATGDADKRLDHTRSLPRQGQLRRDTPVAAAEIWATAVGTVSSMTMKFILNAATDTLPHNSNLSLWGRSVSKNCKLCGRHQALVSTTALSHYSSDTSTTDMMLSSSYC